MSSLEISIVLMMCEKENFNWGINISASFNLIKMKLCSDHILTLSNYTHVEYPASIV